MLLLMRHVKDVYHATSTDGISHLQPTWLFIGNRYYHFACALSCYAQRGGSWEVGLENCLLIRRFANKRCSMSREAAHFVLAQLI